jgi:hypothetical protein
VGAVVVVVAVAVAAAAMAVVVVGLSLVVVIVVVVVVAAAVGNSGGRRRDKAGRHNCCGCFLLCNPYFLAIFLFNHACRKGEMENYIAKLEM